jgi:hypothetical protein
MPGKVSPPLPTHHISRERTPEEVSVADIPEPDPPSYTPFAPEQDPTPIKHAPQAYSYSTLARYAGGIRPDNKPFTLCMDGPAVYRDNDHDDIAFKVTTTLQDQSQKLKLTKSTTSSLFRPAAEWATEAVDLLQQEHPNGLHVYDIVQTHPSNSFMEFTLLGQKDCVLYERESYADLKLTLKQRRTKLLGKKVWELHRHETMDSQPSDSLVLSFESGKWRSSYGRNHVVAVEKGKGGILSSGREGRSMALPCIEVMGTIETLWVDLIVACWIAKEWSVGQHDR